MKTFYLTFCWKSPYKKGIYSITAADFDAAWKIAHDKFELNFHKLWTEDEFKASKFCNRKIIGELNA